MKSLALEPSTNTHLLEADNIQHEVISPEITVLHITGNGVLSHGEHGTLVIESPDALKYVQQEVNPVTGAIIAAFD